MFHQMSRFNTLRGTGLAILFALSLTGCNEQVDADIESLKAVSIGENDQCHLCGMMIAQYPGPKGELFNKDNEEVKKFCSTRDLFGFYLQPENKHRAIKILVHDMSVNPWESPEDDHFIDAKTAWYVWGSSKNAAMGPALASFANETAAKDFAESFGGMVHRFDDITLEMLGSGAMKM
jgi:copper chaperone NosL